MELAPLPSWSLASMEIGRSWSESPDHNPDEAQLGLVVEAAESSPVPCLIHNEASNSPVRWQRNRLVSSIQRPLGPRPMDISCCQCGFQYTGIEGNLPGSPGFQKSDSRSAHLFEARQCNGSDLHPQAGRHLQHCSPERSDPQIWIELKPTYSC